MSAQPATQTLLLYCPYDRRVTRHVRRGPNLDLNCVECGRRVDDASSEDLPEGDAIHLQRTAAITPLPARPRTMARRMGSPVYRSRSRVTWLPYLVVLLVVGVGIYVAFTLVSGTFGTRRAAPASTASTSQPVAESPVAAAPPAPAAAAVRVANTDGLGAYVRRTPSLADRLRPWPDNTLLKVVGPDTTAEGMEWKQIEDPAGNRGWIPAQYTRPEPGT